MAAALLLIRLPLLDSVILAPLLETKVDALIICQTVAADSTDSSNYQPAFGGF